MIVGQESGVVIPFGLQNMSTKIKIDKEENKPSRKTGEESGILAKWAYKRMNAFFAPSFFKPSKTEAADAPSLPSTSFFRACNSDLSAESGFTKDGFSLSAPLERNDTRFMGVESSEIDLKKRPAVLAWTPSLVLFLEPNHHLPCITVRLTTRNRNK